LLPAGSKTVIGREAMAKLDFRLVPDQKVEKVQRLLREHLDKKGFSDVEIQLLTGYESSRTPVDRPFIICWQIGKRFHGDRSHRVSFLSSVWTCLLFGPYTPWAMCSTPDQKRMVMRPMKACDLAILDT